uniref:Vomeronasal type-1 receptor n=1 Tax=Panagrolaimus sp. ES5 TaxID=591445 RepID=A0AC34FP16_9BILA
MGTISTSVLFLGIERCLILLIPHDFTQSRRKLFHTIEIIVLTALATSYVTLNVAQEMPSTDTTNCYTFGCMMVKHSMSSYVYVRYVVALLNSFVGTMLFLIFYNRSKVKDLRKYRFSKNNKLVLWTITAALIFDFMPHFAAFCSNTFFGVNPNHYIGPYGIIATTLDVTLCAEMSRRVFSSYSYKRTGSIMASSV